MCIWGLHEVLPSGKMTKSRTKERLIYIVNGRSPVIGTLSVIILIQLFNYLSVIQL